MGFWDMQLFNKTLLGKQGSRLLTRPDALCTRVIKGEYFPDGEFLTDTRKKKSSTVWKAMLHGRDALYRGVNKRIRPGTETNIWADNWVPVIKSLKPRVRLEVKTLNKNLE